MDFGDDYDLSFTEDGWTEEEMSQVQGSDERFRQQQYSNAYGDYRGGYGQTPPGPFGPPGPPMGMPGMFSRRGRGPPPPIFGQGFGPSGPPVMRARGDLGAIRYLIKCGISKNLLKGLPRNLLDLIEPHYCGLCNYNFESFAQSRFHYVSKQHQKNVKKWLNQYGPMGTHNPQEAPLRSRDLYCELCDVEITSKIHARTHYAGKPHKAVVDGRKNPKNPLLLQPAMERRFKQLIRREKKCLKQAEPAVKEEKKETKDVKPIQEDLYCEICKTAVTCTEQMTAHLNGKRHLQKEKNFILMSMRGEIEPLPVKQEAVEDADAVEDVEDAEDADAVEDVEDADAVEDVEDADAVEATEAVETVEDAEDVEAVKAAEAEEPTEWNENWD